MSNKVLTRDELRVHLMQLADKVNQKMEGDIAMSMKPEWTATCKLRWFNPFPYDGCRLQQAWVKRDGSCEFEWRDVPTEE